jgi:hypothetical protein
MSDQLTKEGTKSRKKEIFGSGTEQVYQNPEAPTKNHLLSQVSTFQCCQINLFHAQHSLCCAL